MEWRFGDSSILVSRPSSFIIALNMLGVGSGYKYYNFVSKKSSLIYHYIFNPLIESQITHSNYLKINFHLIINIYMINFERKYMKKNLSFPIGLDKFAHGTVKPAPD